MKLLVDECTGPSVGRWLREKGHDVYSVGEQSPGWSDWQVLAHAVNDDRIIISNDKDFGELVFKHHVSHRGVVLLRLEDERIDSKITVLDRFLSNFSEPISPQHFIVLTEKTMRITLTQ